MNIFEYQKKLPSKTRINEMMKRAIEMSGSDITELVTEQQVKGMDKNDSNIRPSYTTERYAREKISRFASEAPAGTPDLKRSGETHRTMSLFVKGSVYDFNAQTRYFTHLKKRYNDAYAVAKSNLKSAQSFVTSNFISIFKNETK